MSEPTPVAPGASASRWTPSHAQAAKIALGYLGFGSLWIFGSGWLLHHLVPDGPLAAGLELAKGWCFVAITALLLGLVLNRYFRDIRRAAQQFSLFVEHSPAAIAMLDREMRYLAVSHRWLLDYHLGERNLIGRSHYEVFPEIPESWKAIHRRCLGGAIEKNDAEAFPRADGALDWVRWEVRPWRTADDNIGGLIIFSEVITARVEAEKALRENQTLLAEMGRMAKVGGWDLDPRTGAGHWTEEVARIHELDYSVRPAKEMGFGFYRGDSRARMKAAVQAAIGHGAPYDLELEILTAKGTHKWVRTICQPVQENGKVIKLRGSFQDITARKQAEEAALREQRLLRTLIDLLPDNIYVKDTASRFLVTNAANARVLGKGSPAELMGLSDADFFPIPIAAAFRAQEEKVMAGEALIEFEEENVFPDGRRCVGLSTKVPWRDAEGRICGLVGIGRDITARKEAEEKIRELNRNLEQRVQERTAELRAANEELDAFVYAVSHDLRAPLRAMSGFSQALREDFGNQLPVAARDFLEHIQAGSREMGSLIDGLLRLSRSTRGDLMRETVDLSILALRILDGFHQAEPQRVVTWAVEPGLVVNGDARWLEVVLVNLLGNAWKYTAHRSQPTIRVYSQPGASTTTICVTDNGAGFDPKHAAKLFQPFQRLHREDEFPGLGLGLATVLRIIRRHGGSLQATGTPGAGATFSFSLPQQRL